MLQAAYAAPVGMGKYDSMHLTVITNPALLKSIDENASKVFAAPGRHLLYAAPMLIIVSTSPEGDENTRYSNAAIMAHTMAITATDLDIGCCYIWGAMLALNQNPDLVKELNLPDGFTPSCGLIVGKTTEQYQKRNIPDSRVATNYIK